MLNIDEDLIRQSLSSSLYLRVLAVKKDNKEILTSLSDANFPLIIRPFDQNTLFGQSKKCFERDIFSENIHQLLYPNKIKKNIFI